MRLTDEDLREVLARAEAIQRTALTGPGANAELEVVIRAAEEVGIPRAAVERALRERFDLPARPPQVGELAFARSADGKYYVAEVLATSPDEVRVRFLRGSEHTVAPDEVRACALLPGAKVVVHWPVWGPWTCTVLSYDAGKQTVKVSDGWGTMKTFPIREIWQDPRRTPRPAGSNRARVYATLLGAGAAAGAIIGAVVTALLLR